MANRKTKHSPASGAHSPQPTHQAGVRPGQTHTAATEHPHPRECLEIVVEGPVDEILGAVLDAGLVGLRQHGLGELVNTAVEHEFWRRTHVNQPHARDGEEYAIFEPAYRIGYTLYVSHSGHERSFSEVEHYLRREYELTDSTLPWDKARAAAHAAWERIHEAHLAIVEFLKRRQRFSLEHPPVSPKAVAVRAWFIYENAGYPQGHALDHWLQAEHEQQEHEAIAVRAWFIYENAGHPQGHALDHWLKAEREHQALKKAA